MTSTTHHSEFELGRVVELVRALRDQPFGADERAAAQRCVVDSIGCALGGVADPTAMRTASALSAPDSGVPGLVTVIGSPRRLPVRDAVLANAASIRTLDFNDVYSARNNHHPSESVVPIALAVAEMQDWSGSRLIDAVALGYRISLTVGELWQGLLAAGWAPAASLGQLSNAAFIGTLLGLDDDALINAMAIAAVTAPALAVVFRGELSDAKSLVSGLAAQTAWQAVDLASAGVTGPRDVLEGSGGYDEMVGGKPELGDLSPATWTDSRVVQQKAFPTVFTIHAALEAAIAVNARLAGDARAVLTDSTTRVEVFVPPKVATMAAAPARWTPVNRESAQFSLPYGVATGLLEGRVSADALERSVDGAEAPQTADLVARMTVTPSEQWGGYSGGRVVVSSPSGTTEFEVESPKGSAANPLSDDEIQDKFLDLAATGRSEAYARDALAALVALDAAPSIRPLLELLAYSQASEGIVTR
jgi:2-methylcitrate dehydratase